MNQENTNKNEWTAGSPKTVEESFMSVDIKDKGFELDSGAEQIKNRLLETLGIETKDKILTFSLEDDILYFHSKSDIEKALNTLSSKDKKTMLKNAQDGEIIDLQTEYAENIIKALPIKEEHKHLSDKKQWFFEGVEKAEEILIDRNLAGSKEDIANDESKTKKSKKTHKIKP